MELVTMRFRAAGLYRPGAWPYLVRRPGWSAGL